MKKFIFPLIGLCVAAMFASQASALPAFSRQTGMECTTCHQQHFPVLTAFGRAFKASGYTMVGTQGQVEGEHRKYSGLAHNATLATPQSLTQLLLLMPEGAW